MKKLNNVISAYRAVLFVIVSAAVVFAISGAAAQAEKRSAAATPDAPSTPMGLTQAVTVKRGHDYSLSFGWRSDPRIVRAMQVTLLDRYHLPVAQQASEAGKPIVFLPTSKTYAGRYYRVSVVYSDGAIAMLMGTVGH